MFPILCLAFLIHLDSSGASCSGLEIRAIEMSAFLSHMMELDGPPLLVEPIRNTIKLRPCCEQLGGGTSFFLCRRRGGSEAKRPLILACIDAVKSAWLSSGIIR